MSISGSRIAIDHITLPKPFAAPGWASLPTPPMSGTPPPEPPANPPQIAGRRRKRSQTPPPTTTAAGLSASPTIPLDTSAPRSFAPSRSGEGVGEPSVQSGQYSIPYPPPQGLYQSTSTLSSSSIGLSDPRYATSPISPRATRKPKAHVASACVNCKKKHLRCDSSRPCRRCLQSGKEESCVDVEHKKRGRPPLKPESQDVSAYLASPSTSAMTPRAGPSAGFPPPGYGQSQGYPPLAPNLAPNWSRLQSRGAPPFLPAPAQPSISASYQSAAGMFIPSPAGQYTGRPPILPGPTQMPYTSQPELAGRYGAYAGYGMPPMQGPAQSEYRNPIFPREPQSMQGSSLQLPPILPNTPAPMVDPRLSQQSMFPPVQQGQQPASSRQQDGTEQPQAKRPKMDIRGILGPPRDE